MLYFDYDIDHDILTLQAYKVDVHLHWNNGTVWKISLDDGSIEFDHTDDLLNALSITVGSFPSARTLSLHSVMIEAINQYDGIRRETEQEMRDEQRYADETSSPYLAGRI